jgi:crossover junction endodeoxyribonuclease RusA
MQRELDPSSKTLTFTVDWPPAELSPNARLHWSKKAKAVSEYKELCYWLAIDARNKWELSYGKWEPIEKAVVNLVFLVADKRQRDPDNLVAMCTPLLNAIRCPRGLEGYGARLIVADDVGHMELEWRIEQADEFGVRVTIEESGR